MQQTQSLKRELKSRHLFMIAHMPLLLQIFKAGVFVKTSCFFC
jgi:amino acid permease